jgi:hypothetical protein
MSISRGFVDFAGYLQALGGSSYQYYFHLDGSLDSSLYASVLDSAELSEFYF